MVEDKPNKYQVLSTCITVQHLTSYSRLKPSSESFSLSMYCGTSSSRGTGFTSTVGWGIKVWDRRNDLKIRLSQKDTYNAQVFMCSNCLPNSLQTFFHKPACDIYLNLFRSRDFLLKVNICQITNIFLLNFLLYGLKCEHIKKIFDRTRWEVKRFDR